MAKRSDDLKRQLRNNDAAAPKIILLILGGGLVAVWLDDYMQFLPWIVGIVVIILVGHLYEQRRLKLKIIEAEIEEHNEEKAR